MYRYTRWLLTAVLLFAVGAAWGQNLRLDDPPKFYVPKKPPTRQELNQRDSLHQYVNGLILQYEERYADALKAFEEAARLDPDAPALYKAQIPLLVGMDRLPDALVLAKKVVALDPGDYSTWYVLAKLHKSSARPTDAIAALERGLQAAAIKDHPGAAQQLWLDLGGLHEGLGKFGPAADAYAKAAAILEHPDQIQAKAHVPREAILARASETYEKIGELHGKAKQYDQAIAALEKSQALAPERAGRLNYVIAKVCDEQGNLPGALKFMDAYLQTQPLSIEPYELKINLLRRLKKTEAIVPWLEEAATRDRFNTGMQLLLAKEYAQAKLPAKAEAIYTKLAEDSPSADLYRGLFQLYKDEGPAGMARTLALLDKTIEKASRTDGPPPVSAVNHAKAMVAALREDGELARKLVETAFRRKVNEPELKHDTVYFLAILADQHRKGVEAERFYTLSLKGAQPTNEPIIYSGLLRALAQQRKHEATVKLCQDGLAKSKTTNPLLFFREAARALAALHRYDDALRQADLAAKQADDDNRLLFQLLRVRILTMAQRFDDAETECKALLKTHEKPADAVELRYVLSNIYSASKQQAKSEEQLHLILKIDPDNATANNDLGYLWADQAKNLAAAEAMIRKALDLDRVQRRRNPNFSLAEDKDNAAYVDSLGWVLFRRGQVEEAKKELERAAALDGGEDPTIYDHLGDVYNRLKMRPEASRVWQRALKLYQQGARGKDEERIRDLRRKIERVKEEIGGR
ncbi:MAG: tetratricopeptide repeat protein [Gemmataceae bacterium]|nr:tetratricopeptide repeat protein [Gemmataceae bacterium]